MDYIDARILLEDAIYTLMEVGNGTTDEMLHHTADQLVKFRDEWFKRVLSDLA